MGAGCGAGMPRGGRGRRTTPRPALALAGVALVLAAGMLAWGGGAARAAGPETVKTVAGPGRVRVAFTPAPSVTYTVYRHAYEQERAVAVVGWVTTDAQGGIVPGSEAPAGAWTKDDPVFPRMLVFTDTGVEDFKEYYYLVDTGGFDGTNFQDYVVMSAFPPETTRHGNFTSAQAPCTACHGLHSSMHPKLIKAATVRDLCFTCHDGTGSKYNVADGLVRVGPSWATKASSFAGPFGKRVWDKAGVESTSAHDEGSGVQVRQAPGAGVVPVTDSWEAHLSCTSCHDPHNKWQNYRSLRGLLHGERRIVRGFSEVSWTAPDRSDAVTVNEHVYGVNSFCASCHRFFLDPRYGSEYKGTEGVAGTHRHPVGMAPADYANVQYGRMSWQYEYGYVLDGTTEVPTGPFNFEDARPLTPTLPLEGTFAGGQYNLNVIMCLTCHNAHGTAYGGLNNVAYLNGPYNGTEGAVLEDTGYTNRAAALAGRLGSAVNKRLPNMGVCQNCHQK